MTNPSVVNLIAAEVFRARNAAAAPARFRQQLKLAMRPDLRAALRNALDARELLRHDDAMNANTKLLLARYWLNRAELTYGKIMAGNYSAGKRSAALVPRKVDDSLRKRILKQYQDLPKYGAIKALCREFELSRPTISRIVSKKNSK